MKNLFDVASFPDDLPESLVAGSQWAWTRPDITEAYPTAEYTLRFNFLNQEDDLASFDITASKVDGSHAVQDADTGSRAAGLYRWIAWVIRDSDSAEVAVDEGFVTVTASATAGASYVWRVLQAIRATIEGTASNEQASIQYRGRTLMQRSVQDLMGLEREFTRRWQEEQNKLNQKQGRRGGKRTLVKMGA